MNGHTSYEVKQEACRIYFLINNCDCYPSIVRDELHWEKQPIDISKKSAVESNHVINSLKMCGTIKYFCSER
jgi:hypothetical protein